MSRQGVASSVYGTVVAASLCYTCLMFVWFSLPAYLTAIIDDLGLTGTQAGVLTGAVPLTYIPLALFSGLFIDRVGPSRSLAAGVVVFGLAQIGRSGVSSFGPMLAVTFVVGIGATMITFGLPKLVSLLFPPDRTGLPSAMYLVGAQAGTASAFALGRPVLGPLLGGWRPLFFWSGIVAIAYACVWAVVSHVGASRPDDAEVAPSFSLSSVTDDIRVIVSHRGLRMVVLVGTMYLFVLHGLQGWLPTILEWRGLGADPASRTTSILVGANVAGVLAVPTLADRWSVRREAILACGTVVLGGAIAVVVGSLGPAMILGVVATGVGVGGLSPLVRAIPPDFDAIGPRLTGTAIGFVFAIGEIGGFLGPVVIGTSYDLWSSYTPGLLTFACAGVVVVVAGHRMRGL